MSKQKSKKKLIIIVIAVIILLGVAAAVWYLESQGVSRDCRDIIGDGYYMGTDPEPVVIGNTCD